MFGGYLPHRFVATVDPGDRMAAGQRIDGGAHAFGGAQPKRTVGHRGLLALEMIQGVLQCVMQLLQGQRPAAGGQQDRRCQRRGVDRGRPQDSPGHLEGHLLHRKPLCGWIFGKRAIRLTEVFPHRHRGRETHVNLAVVPLALGLDEVVKPLRTLGNLLSAAGVRGALVVVR